MKRCYRPLIGLAHAAAWYHLRMVASKGRAMRRIASFWTGLLKAGAVALVLALFGFATASAHENHDAHQPVSASVQTAAQTDCHEQQGVQKAAATTHDHAHKHGQGMADDCCKDACACGCAASCAAHVGTGLPVATALTLPVPAGLLLPGRAIDPASLTTPPDPRPPLTI
ncbi:hypothetical protein IP70_02275 [alpha proteobacterium AAP38]|nr:hypothetical protein IP70_02275 [alpha proteobacterium AAP38]